MLTTNKMHQMSVLDDQPYMFRLRYCERQLYIATLMDDLVDSRSSPRGLWLNGFSGAGQHGAL